MANDHSIQRLGHRYGYRPCVAVEAKLVSNPCTNVFRLTGLIYRLIIYWWGTDVCDPILKSLIWLCIEEFLPAERAAVLAAKPRAYANAPHHVPARQANLHLDSTCRWVDSPVWFETDHARRILSFVDWFHVFGP